MWIELLLFVVAIFAGALNAIAGGGTFFAFPALIFAGVPPIMANATCTLAVWPGAIASAFAYRHELNRYAQRLPLMILISLIGGGAGAFVLLHTPAQTFEFLIPWLLLVATLLFTFSPSITAFLNKNSQEHFVIPAFVALALQGIIAFYGGYFGAGIGILMLALLSLLGMGNLHEMNALKTILGSAINGVAVVMFIFGGAVHWDYGLVMVVGAILGGYGGAHLARKLPVLWIRRAVILIASSLTLYFFWQVR
jgi:uncharacterized membrane protein YfcA